MNTAAPIIIAGMGPSGSILALALAKQNIAVILLEKDDTLPIDLRASTFHPPSLDLIADLDIDVINSLLRKGLKATRYQYRDRVTGEVATFEMDLLEGETQHPYRLQLEQYELTHCVLEVLKTYTNVDVRFSHEALTYIEKYEGVQVSVMTPNGRISIEGSFVIGCDGARSNIRKSAGIEYGGFTYDEKFLVVSTDFAFEKVFDDFSYVNYISDPDEWCVILRTEKIWRVLFPTSPKNKDDEQNLLSDAFIEERLQHFHPKDTPYNVPYRTLYSVNQRVASSYCKGRMALVGDSCHINNPLGGMGMNGGLHDAFNLAARLIDIIKHGASFEHEFIAYDRQRRCLAMRFVQEHTINNKKLMESRESDVQEKRQKFFMKSASDPILAKRFMMERSMIDSLRDSLKS